MNILANLQLSLRNNGLIFTDPQGKKAHRSAQILKESSTWATVELNIFKVSLNSKETQCAHLHH